MLTQLKSKAIKQDIYDLLLAYPELRDNDNRLMCCIWHKQLTGDKVKTMSAVDMMHQLATNKLISPESIMRLRRKVQESNVELRGKNYKPRKKEEVVIKQAIHNV